MNKEEWILLDAELMEAEHDIRESNTTILEALEASLTDWDEYLHSLSPNNAQAALNGLREYLREMGAEV